MTEFEGPGDDAVVTRPPLAGERADGPRTEPPAERRRPGWPPVPLTPRPARPQPEPAVDLPGALSQALVAAAAADAGLAGSAAWSSPARLAALLAAGSGLASTRPVSGPASPATGGSAAPAVAALVPGLEAAAIDAPRLARSDHSSAARFAAGIASASVPPPPLARVGPAAPAPAPIMLVPPPPPRLEAEPSPAPVLPIDRVADTKPQLDSRVAEPAPTVTDAATAAPPPTHRPPAQEAPPPPAAVVPPSVRAPVPLRVRPAIAPVGVARPVGAAPIPIEPPRAPPDAVPAALPDAAPLARPRGPIRRWLRRALLAACGLLALHAAIVLGALVAYRTLDPPFTTLTLAQRLMGEEIDQRWVPLDAISRRLQLAVIMSEDGRFCQHPGVDLTEIEAALERGREGLARGASTISMQVVKNLFLWPSRSYVRKALEIPITLVMEQILSKRRILEIYLNVAEWGPGIFGIEAASRYHFSKPASRLDEWEAALLAVGLPNPAERVAGNPGHGTQRLARTIEARMRAAGPARLACLAGK